MIYDFVIVGGGIVGLATGIALTDQLPGRAILVLEKEDAVARHQTGHNSGVIHSGIYYKPGSLKARLAVRGCSEMVAFCERRRVPYEVCGKVIVATEPEEISRLDTLQARARENGVPTERLNPGGLRDIEPHAAGLAALRVLSTGIVDYRAVAREFARVIAEGGGDLRMGAEVRRVVPRSDTIAVETTAGDFAARTLINCAGLHSDRIARLCGLNPKVRIVPFRGEYYELTPEKRGLVRHLIYPVPNQAFPFLGVHFTRMMDSTVHAGPNAVLGLKREGYRKTDVNLSDAFETLTYPAFWRLAGRNAREGVKEVVRSFSKTAFVRSLQRLIPEITAQDVVPTHAGVRAQALARDGSLVDDFLIQRGERSIHVLNAPSPAATASIEIGRAIVEML